MVVDGEAVALPVTHRLDILALYTDLPGSRRIGTSDNLKECRFARAIRSHHADNFWFLKCVIDGQLERGRTIQNATMIGLANAVEREQWCGHFKPPKSFRLRDVSFRRFDLTCSRE